MFLIPRHQEILDIARTQGKVLVEDLASRFEITPQTIRKDLNDLCEKKLLNRIHGGAVFPSGTENMQYEQRRMIAAPEKEAIGKAAARLIHDNASLFVNIGTTTEAVSQALLDHGRLMIITNNINVANRLRVYPQFEVVIAGAGDTLDRRRVGFHQLDHRLAAVGDDDLFAAQRRLDQLRQLGFGFEHVDLHGALPGVAPF